MDDSIQQLHRFLCLSVSLVSSDFPLSPTEQVAVFMHYAYANIANMGMGSWQSLGIKHNHLQHYHCPLHCNVVIINQFSLENCKTACFACESHRLVSKSSFILKQQSKAKEPEPPHRATHRALTIQPTAIFCNIYLSSVLCIQKLCTGKYFIFLKSLHHVLRGSEIMDGCPSIIIPSDLELHCYRISIYCCLLLHLLVCSFQD